MPNGRLSGYHEYVFFKLRLGALIPRSVCLSVCLSVCRSVCPPKITKNYKTLQNLSKHYKTLENDKTRIICPLFMCEDRQGSFGGMPELSWRSCHFLAYLICRNVSVNYWKTNTYLSPLLESLITSVNLKVTIFLPTSLFQSNWSVRLGIEVQ